MNRYDWRHTMTCLWTLLAMCGCFKKEETTHSTTSSTQRPYVTDTDKSFEFIEMWHPSGCLIAHVHEPTIKICVTGGGNIDTGKARTQEAITLWTAHLKASFTGVTSEVEFTCQGHHGTVTVHSGNIGGSMGSPSGVVSGDQNAIGTWYHEFGHAFACLGDTYVGTSAGVCQTGQPVSVMCHGLLVSNLYPDDYDGAMTQYLKLFPNSTPNTADDDSDNVENRYDRCPNTPAGAIVWTTGNFAGCANGQTVVFHFPLPPAGPTLSPTPQQTQTSATATATTAVTQTSVSTVTTGPSEPPENSPMPSP